MLLLLLACEPSAGPAKPDPDPFDSGPTRPTDTAPTEPPVEACNGWTTTPTGRWTKGSRTATPTGSRIAWTCATGWPARWAGRWQ